MVDAMVLVASVYFSVVICIFRKFDDRCINEYYKVSHEVCRFFVLVM